MKRVGRYLPAATVAICTLALCGSASAAARSPSVVRTTIKTVHVAWGKIGYRSLGRGRPLVLVTGAYDSIDIWAPSFVDALARTHHLFLMDNEGVGRTTLRAGKLTITRMGDDVADFIAALRLGRPDVLGWSMGGDITLALAVRHPGSVRRIILCAAIPGDGTALPPSGLRSKPLYADLFPPDQDAARLEFIREIHRYPGYYQASPAISQQQIIALAAWFSGLEPAGHQLNRIAAAALIADGAKDPGVPVANLHILAREIPHARLHIYPDASHGFWYQERTDFVPRINRFLR